MEEFQNKSQFLGKYIRYLDSREGNRVLLSKLPSTTIHISSRL